MVYKYKWRATAYPVPAQKAGEYIHDISEKENGITAERLLELSRDENALMHKCFEWDDTKAAEKYRLKQSGQIINGIVVVAINDKPVEKIRAFASVTSRAHSETGVFKAIARVFSEADSKKIMLENALMELEMFKKKYQTLTELEDVIAAIDDAVREIKEKIAWKE